MIAVNKLEKFVSSKQGIDKLVSCVKLRAELQDPDYISVVRSLDEVYESADDVDAVQYHRSCYRRTTNKEHISRTRKKSSLSSSSTDTDVDCRKTRSTHTPFDKGMCLYCQSDREDEQLHDCMTKNTGIKIRNSLSGNQALEIRINTVIDSTDARAINMKYHLKCYTKELRKKVS